MSQPAIALAGAKAATKGKRPATRSFWRNVGRRLLRDPVSMVCLTLLLLIVLAAIFAPYVAPHDPYRTSMARRLIAPGDARYWLGTDELGRDLLSRLIYGGRLSLFMGFAPVLIATAIGGLLGIIAGYVGGALNMLIMRVIDVFYAFPSVLLAVAISGVLGAGIGNTIFSLTLVFIPPVARVAESVATQMRNQDFVEAARATGAANWRIVLAHVVPNVTGPILSYASSLISVSIVLAAGLSFLGLGITPPEPEWGLMLNTLRQSIYVAPLNAILPGVMIFITSMCFNLMSDGLRSAMDVKQ
ncbi:ABC transporter permease protein [Azorhizobium caulinodans ORS 571]|uniref:ABC transporter permease protein n=1 Tax=Azorhizobium caulinodans (strain ATCC 43989 / DSM 5975 / JCM 20966 / LMG 6465 / NBRC 14845 / NCIMB 13405 / ORS 571) TaxID=438753 RepID=A8IB91_AZOC5|nr:ABC transporter permease [Azorhizobium caulinodans]BAF88626.1 ABC transporter permease protein [Azorhizobium caulinodans ORS 571]